MQYRLITTKQGLIPIQDVKQGMEVLSNGEWKISPSPCIGKCIRCKFDTLPTTIFEKQFITRKQEVSVNHKPILNKFEELNIGLAVRGCTSEDAKRNYGSIVFTNRNADLYYWYPRIISYCGTVTVPTIKYNSIIFYTDMPKLSELEGNDLSERNLEIYLEGLLRRRFIYSDNQFKLTEKPSESDRLVLRLLDIGINKISLGTAVNNPVGLLKHIRDGFNKSKITENMIVTSLIHHINLPQYTPGNKIISREECDDYILPGINPDINTLSPINDHSITNNKLKNRIPYVNTSRLDSQGRQLKKYNSNNYYEQLKRNSIIDNKGE